jgi:hypothetical protein
MPVAAVTVGGSPSVSSGSSSARSGRITGETTPFFSCAPVVTMEIGVTSEPVPAVVGICTSGSRGCVQGFLQGIGFKQVAIDIVET